MDNRDVLSGGLDVLTDIKEQILELEGYKTRCEELALEEERAERAAVVKEKQINEEVADILRRRKEEIEASFEEQSEKIQARIKKIKLKKEKFKNGKMSERIEMETAGLAEDNRQLKADAKAEFKQAHVPGLLNTQLYYGLFMPKRIEDFCICIAAFLVCFIGIPVLTYVLIPQHKTWYWILIYVAALLIFGGLYILIHNTTKAKYADSLVVGRRLLSKIHANKKQMKAIRKNIEKDKDESIYGLEKFDEEILELENGLTEINRQKKEASLVFDNTTKNVITAEIRGRNQEELDRLKAQHDQTYAEWRNTEDRVKEKSLFVAENYEAYLGKDCMSVMVVDKMLALLEQGEVDSIGAALARYKTEV